MQIDPDTCRDPDLLAAEVRRLREAIRRLADQDATLSVQGGDVTVTMDTTLTAEELVALNRVAVAYELLPGYGAQQVATTILGLLKRLSPQERQI